MSLEENKALVQKWIQAGITNDPAALDEIFAADYRVNDTLAGLAGVKQAVAFLQTALSDISAEAQDLVAESDRAVLRWTIRGWQTGNSLGVLPTSQTLELAGINIDQIAAGKISAYHEQTNIPTVLQKLIASGQSGGNG